MDINLFPLHTQTSGARIVILNVFEDTAREIFCIVSYLNAYNNHSINMGRSALATYTIQIVVYFRHIVTTVHDNVHSKCSHELKQSCINL